MKRIPALIVTAIITAGSWTVLPAFAEDTDDWNRAETEHLRIEWKAGDLSDEGLAMVKAEGERFYALIHEMLGHAPKAKVTILMRGDAQQPDGSWGYPRVDGFARLHLFKFGPTHLSYFSALAHEMVHVFRFRRAPDPDWFLEEGFAEFVALRVDSSLAGFPWYGMPITVATGQWFANGEDIPLQTLRERHRALNQPCKAQSYTLRSSFFDYLGREYGDSAVLELAGQERVGELSDYTRFFGKDFDALAAEWQEWLLAEYNGIDGVENLARQYRKETPIQYNPICKKGDQF